MTYPISDRLRATFDSREVCLAKLRAAMVVREASCVEALKRLDQKASAKR